MKKRIYCPTYWETGSRTSTMPWRHSCFSQAWSGNVSLIFQPASFPQATCLVFSTPTDTNREEWNPAISLLKEIGSTSSQFSSVQVAQSCQTLCDPTDCSTSGFPVHHQMLEPTQNSCPSSRWCHPTISSSVRALLLLPSIFPSIRVFFNESVLHVRWPKYWSFRFSISPSNEYSGLISLRIGWLDFLAVHRTLKSLPQHYSSRASILWCSAFFTIQLLNIHTCLLEKS